MRFLFYFNHDEADFLTAHNAAKDGKLIEGHKYLPVAQFDHWASNQEIFSRAGNDPYFAGVWEERGFKVRSMSVGDFIYDPSSCNIHLCQPYGWKIIKATKENAPFVSTSIPRYALQLDKKRIEAMQMRLAFCGQSARNPKYFGFNILHPDGQFFRMINVCAKDEDEATDLAEIHLALEISKMGMPLILSD